VVQELWIHPRYPSLRGLLSFIPRSQEFPNAETLVFKSSESTIIDELRSVVWPEGKYPLPSTLVLYIPCWTFVDFYKFAEVLRRHHANLRKVRVRAMVWVDREAVVKVLGDIAKDNETLALWMALTSTPTLGVWNYRRSAQWVWKCGIRPTELRLIEQKMQNIFSQEIDLDQWSQMYISLLFTRRCKDLLGVPAPRLYFGWRQLLCGSYSSTVIQNGRPLQIRYLPTS